MVESILRLPATMERTGLSRSTIYLKMKDGSFPKSIKLGERAIGWPDSAISDWISEQIRKSS